MTYNSRIFALFLSSIIAGITASFLSLLKDTSLTQIIVSFILAFSSSFLLIYITLEFFIFREIEKLYAVLEEIKLDKFNPKRKKKKKSTNPFNKINDVMYQMASTKQIEIDQLKQNDIYRREFLANVAHELKTPIFSASGFVNTLLDGADDDKKVRKKFLKKAAKSIDNLDNLVKDLLVISQIESGDIRMNKEYFDLRKLIEEIFEQLEKKAEEKNITMKYLSNIEGPIETYGDVYRLKQVIVNLVDNSIKYGKENGETIVDIQKHDNEIDVKIKDNGPGIEQQHLQRIFERFYRIDKSRSRERGGTGLGLSIVKHILEVHDSDIFAESQVGKGSTFSFTIINPEDEDEY